MDELDEESDEAHDGEADGGGDRDLLELCGCGTTIYCKDICESEVRVLKLLTLPVWLGAPLDEPDGVLGELFHGLHKLRDLIHLGVGGVGGLWL